MNASLIVAVGPFLAGLRRLSSRKLCVLDKALETFFLKKGSSVLSEPVSKTYTRVQKQSEKGASKVREHWGLVQLEDLLNFATLTSDLGQQAYRKKGKSPFLNGEGFTGISTSP